MSSHPIHRLLIPRALKIPDTLVESISLRLGKILLMDRDPNYRDDANKLHGDKDNLDAETGITGAARRMEVASVEADVQPVSGTSERSDFSSEGEDSKDKLTASLPENPPRVPLVSSSNAPQPEKKHKKDRRIGRTEFYRLQFGIPPRAAGDISVQDELRQKYSLQRGLTRSLPKLTGVNRCLACRDRKYRLCDRPVQEDSVCSFCRRNCFNCVENPFSKARLDIFSVGKISSRVEAEGADFNPDLPKAIIKELPVDLRVESELLDGIYRAASWHAKVYNEQRDANIYGCMDNHCLLSFGILAQELIKHQLTEYLMPARPTPPPQGFEEKFKYGEFRLEIGNRDTPHRKWMEMLKNPPIPPYLKRKTPAEDQDEEEEDAGPSQSPKFLRLQDESDAGEESDTEDEPGEDALDTDSVSAGSTESVKDPDSTKVCQS